MRTRATTPAVIVTARTVIIAPRARFMARAGGARLGLVAGIARLARLVPPPLAGALGAAAVRFPGVTPVGTGVTAVRLGVGFPVGNGLGGRRNGGLGGARGRY